MKVGIYYVYNIDLRTINKFRKLNSLVFQLYSHAFHSMCIYNVHCSYVNVYLEIQGGGSVFIRLPSMSIRSNIVTYASFGMNKIIYCSCCSERLKQRYQNWYNLMMLL